MDMMRSRYFELLLKKADEASDATAETDLYDRIERLIELRESGK
jgi:hypothetical protein